jgi:hypothetical protein
MPTSTKLAEEQAKLEAMINAGGADELEVAADALRLPDWGRENRRALRRREAQGRAVPAAATSPPTPSPSRAQLVFFGNYQEYEADKKKRLDKEAARPHRIKFRTLKII